MTVIEHKGTLNQNRTTWKSISYITDRSAYRRLQGSWLSSKGVLGKYTIQLNSHWGIETNLPWSELRAWFRSSDVPLRTDLILTSRLSLEEMYGDNKDE